MLFLMPWLKMATMVNYLAETLKVEVRSWTGLYFFFFASFFFLLLTDTHTHTHTHTHFLCLSFSLTHTHSDILFLFLFLHRGYSICSYLYNSQVWAARKYLNEMKERVEQFTRYYNKEILPKRTLSCSCDKSRKIRKRKTSCKKKKMCALSIFKTDMPIQC